MESGHKLSRHELRVEQRDAVASLTPSEEKVDKRWKSRRNQRGEVGGREVAEIAAGRDHRRGGRGRFSEPNIEANEEVVREVQRGNH